MKDETLVLIVVATMIALFSYINLVATEYKPVESNVSSSTFTPDRVKPNEIPELPELNEEEQAQTDSLFKSYVKEAEEVFDLIFNHMEQSVNDLLKQYSVGKKTKVWVEYQLDSHKYMTEEDND